MEQAELQQKLEQLKKEIRLISFQLKELGEKKESEYKKKDNINHELNSAIKDAKELHDKKKETDLKIKDLKVKRQTLNKELSESWAKFRESRTHIISSSNKKKIRPSNIQKQIEKIEFAIQTEALSFEREKKLMQQLHELKAGLQQLQLEESKFKELREFKDKVKSKKVEADGIHVEIQKLASESSGIFKQLTEKSESIAKAKKTRENINQVLQKLKEQISNFDDKLAELLQQWGALTSSPLFAEQEIVPNIQNKAEQALKKLRTKGKLTKEDILALQRQR